MIRRRVLPCMLAMAAPAVIGGWSAAAAQDKPAPENASPPPQSGCVYVETEGDPGGRLACIQQRLRAAAREAQEKVAPLPGAPLDARSTDTRVGVANEAATRQRMGNQFGVSVHPQRPPAPKYTPLGPPR